MISFKGRSELVKYYEPSKPTKLGFHGYVIADCQTYYTYAFDLCQEFEREENFNKTETLVLLTELTSGHILYVDSFYTSLQLADDLRSKGIGMIGTIRKDRNDRKCIAKDTKFKEYYMSSVDVLVTIWKDKKLMTLISTYRKSGMNNENTKPNSVEY